jgi:hypothetical protein
MYFPNRNLNPRDRVIFQIGNFSLVAGLLLWMFVHPTSQIEKNWLEAVSGFLFGFYITVNLFVLRFGCRGRGPLTPTGTASAPQP